jgi:hypothetical protein
MTVAVSRRVRERAEPPKAGPLLFFEIQSICNGKSGPSAIQSLEKVTENPSAQEQWEAMEEQ